MAKKKKTNLPTDYVLPSNQNELETEVRHRKYELMEHIVDSIDHAVQNNLTFVELFRFNGSEFVIELTEKEFLSNLNNIYKRFIENEMYEKCSKIVKLQNILKIKTGHIINHEK